MRPLIIFFSSIRNFDSIFLIEYTENAVLWCDVITILFLFKHVNKEKRSEKIVSSKFYYRPFTQTNDVLSLNTQSIIIFFSTSISSVSFIVCFYLRKTY